MKHIATFILCCMAWTVGHGQTMTLRECVTAGIDRNIRLRNARIDIAKGRTGVSQNRSRLLPVIDGVVQLTDYLKSPVNVTTGTLLGSDFPDDPTWQTIKTMKYNANAGVRLTMPIYNQSILAAIDVARTVERIGTLSYEKAVEELTVQISKVYYMAQASRELERLAADNIARMEELCVITEALYGQGVVMEVDLNRVRINLQSLRSQRDQQRTLHEQQLNMLRYLMDMAPETPLQVVRMKENVEPLSDEDTGVSGVLPDLLLAESQRELAERRISTVRAGYLPVLSLTGYAGGIGYHEKFGRLADNWFGNCYVGLSVRIPLFEANSKRLQIRQYRYDAQQAANRTDLLRKQLGENYANALLQLNHNMEVLRTQSDCRRQAEDVYNITEEQYKEGVASMTSLLQDEMQLRTAQAACVQAHCQCDLARLELLRLSGRLERVGE